MEPNVPLSSVESMNEKKVGEKQLKLKPYWLRLELLESSGIRFGIKFSACHCSISSVTYRVDVVSKLLQIDAFSAVNRTKVTCDEEKNQQQQQWFSSCINQEVIVIYRAMEQSLSIACVQLWVSSRSCVGMRSFWCIYDKKNNNIPFDSCMHWHCHWLGHCDSMRNKSNKILSHKAT